MFEQIYQRPRVIERHLQAPLRSEREQYLKHMLEEGYTYGTLAASAAYMLQLIRILGLHELRIVYEDEIKRAAEFWAEYKGPFRNPGHGNNGSPRSFIKFTRAWLKFHGKLGLSPAPPFHEQTEAFSDALQFDYGLAAATVRGYSNRAQAFLTWLAAQGGDLEAVSVTEI
ncbi:MAG: hypothetical protein JF563_04720, partial [Acidobacteriales bacterium]|nr:hypothetical protein [Terriglobales bacterium]